MTDLVSGDSSFDRPSRNSAQSAQHPWANPAAPGCPKRSPGADKNAGQSRKRSRLRWLDWYIIFIYFYLLFIYCLFVCILDAYLCNPCNFKAVLINIFNKTFLITLPLGNTPLHTAVHATFRNIANMLVQAGADERKKNLSGLTPFQLGWSSSKMNPFSTYITQLLVIIDGNWVFLKYAENKDMKMKISLNSAIVKSLIPNLKSNFKSKFNKIVWPSRIRAMVCHILITFLSNIMVLGSLKCV